MAKDFLRTTLELQVTRDEATWLHHQLTPTDDDPVEVLPLFTWDLVGLRQPLFSVSIDEFWGFGVEVLDQLTRFLQAFLYRWRPSQEVFLTYAEHNTGRYGGGAYVIGASSVEKLRIEEWIQMKQETCRNTEPAPQEKNHVGSTSECEGVVRADG